MLEVSIDSYKAWVRLKWHSVGILRSLVIKGHDRQCLENKLLFLVSGNIYALGGPENFGFVNGKQTQVLG